MDHRRPAPTTFSARFACIALLGLSACTTPELAPALAEPEIPRDGLVGALIALPTRPEFAEIARLEEQRLDPENRLLELLATADGPVRARAARAVGRMPLVAQGDALTQALCLALDDPDRGVRREAAFALGRRNDPTAAGVLGRNWPDPDASVRARLVDAGSRIGEQELKEQILRSLSSDPDLSVRLEAIMGTSRWDGEARDAVRINRELLAALNPLVRPASRAEPAPDEIWMTLFALQRRKAERGLPAFLEHVDDDDANARLFATKGLARLAPTTESTRGLERRSRDADWRIACEALLGLANHADRTSIPSIRAALDNRNSHVRQSAIQALGSFVDHPDDVVPVILEGIGDRSASVRAAALVSLAKVADPRQTVGELRRAASPDADPVVLVGIAEAAGILDPETGDRFIAPLLDHAQPFVAGAAITALGQHPTPQNLARLRDEIDGQSDNGRRLAAVLSMRPHSSAADLRHLENAIDSSAGDVAPELAWNAVENVRLIATAALEARDDETTPLEDIDGHAATLAAAIEILKRELRYPHARVREVSRLALEQLAPELELPDVPPPPTPTRELPLPGIDFPNWTRNPLVEMETSRGTMVFELYPSDAPLHVYNFLKTVESGSYDSLTFHRVVPNFVIQGGDYRGDGNGGVDWRGTQLRAEFNPRKFLRGSLGTPRSEDFESGGSQIFVTHRPTPHLDGNYTLFGQLVRGFDVLDRIEVGDRILSARQLAEPQPRVPFGNS